VLSTVDYELNGYKNALFIKVDEQPIEVITTADVGLGFTLPIAKKYKTDVLFTHETECTDGCIGLDRYNYMFFTKVVCITKERSKEPNIESWAKIGYRCIIIQEI
jgi:hypothetical protein